MATSTVYLRKPNGKRKRWRLILNGKTFSCERIAAINEGLLSGTVSSKRAEAMALQVLKEYRESERAKIVPAYLPENESLARKYIAEVLALKTNRAPRAAEDRILRAAKSVGKLSIRSASLLELRAALDKYEGRPYNDRIGALNQLLTFCGRGNERLPKKPESQPAPRFLTLEEFQKVVSHLNDINLRTLCWTAFGTGARFGELFALERVEQGQVFVRGQLRAERKLGKRHFKLAIPKNKKTGWAAIVPESEKWVKHWIDLDTEIKLELRKKTKLSETVKEACRKVFPKDPNKWLTFHDFRHSYAKYCLENGKTLEDVREWLRDNMATVERYYVGWGQGRRRGFL